MNQRFGSAIDHIVWEPQLPLKPFRRAPWEQATIIDVTVGGARVRARANRAITSGTRISIGSDGARGLVEVCRIEATSNASVGCYDVRFIWLDSGLQMRLDEEISTATSGDVEWRRDSATERPPSRRHHFASLAAGCRSTSNNSSRLIVGPYSHAPEPAELDAKRSSRPSS